MYCDLCSNRTTGAYCSNKGCRKFTKQSLDEHAARYHKVEVGSHNVRQQLSEEQLRIRTTSPDRGFVKSRAKDQFSPGAGPKTSDLYPASGILKWAKTAYN